jgi:hypothetical protein
MFVVSCSRAPAPPPNEVSTTSERGPIRLTVTASPKDAWVGDTLRVELALTTPEGYSVGFPPSSALGDLSVRAIETPPAQTAPGGSLVRRQIYLVDVHASGRLDIPPLTVGYSQSAAVSAVGPISATSPAIQPAYEHELVSEPLTLEIRSALTTQDSVEKPRDITGTLAAPPRPWTWKDWTMLAATVAAAAALGYGVYRYARWVARLRARPIVPEIWALRALAELERANWFAAGRVRDYYYRVTEVVRRYIELKFDLRAPEMTTEEFFRELSHNRAALPYDADRLRMFLESCDIVKYAAFKPGPEDAAGALATARAFVNATAAAVEARNAAARAAEAARSSTTERAA